MKYIYIAILVVLGLNLAAANEKNSLLAPSATISGGATVCQNATSPVITFTGSGGTAPYTFTYALNGISQTPIVSSGNVGTVNANTSTTGTFTYNLVSVQDSSGTQNLNLTPVVINVNASPIIDFTFTNDNTCSGTAIQFTTSVSGSGTTTYSWDFGDGTPFSTLQNPTHSFTSLGCGTGSFSVILTVTRGGCIVTKTHAVMVKQKPDIDFTDVINPFDPFSNCSNAASNPVYLITVDNASLSSCISSFSINWGDGNIQNNATFPASHTYNLVGAYSMVITAFGSNGCNNSKTYIIKNVSNPLGGINSPGSTQNLCAPTSNLQFSISNWGTNSLDTTYTINYGDGTPIQILNQTQMVTTSYYDASNPSNSSSYPIPHVYATSSCPATSFLITLDITNACGTTPLTLGNISILTKPTANFTSPQNGCVNTSILFTNTTVAGYGQGCIQSSIYTWNFGDGSPTVTTPLSPPTNINHTYPSLGNYTVTLTAQNFCGITTKTQQICIEPPLAPLFTAPTSGCIPFAFTAINNTAPINQCSTPAYNWHVTYAAGSCGTSITPIPDQTTTNGNFNFTEPGTYTIALTATNACTPSQTITQTVTVRKPPTVAITAITDFCQSTTLTPVASVNTCDPNTAPLPAYLWTFSGGTPSSQTTEIPTSVSYAIASSYSVSLAVTNECGTTIANSNTFNVQLAPIVQNETTIICSGTPFSVTPSNATAGNSIPVGTTYSWNTPTVTGGVTGGLAGTNQTIISGTLINPTNNAQTATYIITPKIGNCTGSTFTLIVTVNPSPTITTQPTPSTVCLGGTPTPLSVTLSSTSVTPTYQWYSNSNDTTVGSTLIIGATTATFNPPTTVTGTLYYYCVVSLSSGGCSSINSTIVAVIVNPLPTITTQPTATQNLCVGVTIPSPLTVTYSGGSGTATYQWYSNTNNSTTGGTPVGTDSSSYIPPVFNAPGTFYYYATVALSGNGCGSATSTTAEVVVVADPTLTTQPLVSQTLCQGANPTTLQVTATGGNGTFSYQWYSNVANNTTSGNLISGANNATYIPPTTTVGTLYYYCIISQATLGCDVTSTTSAVIINASPAIVNQPVSSTVCLGGTPTVLSLTYTNGVGTPTYQWYSNISNDNITGTPITGETNPTFTPPSTAVGTIYYYCAITFSGITGGCATIPTNATEVTITAASTINQQPLPTQSLCVGTTIPTPLTVSYTGGTGTPSYQWFVNTTNSNAGGTLISGATNVNYTPPVYNTSSTYYYYVIINFSGNGCGAITSDTAEVIVVADPTINTQPLVTQTLCQNSPATVLTVAASGGIGTSYNYQWYSSVSNNTTSGTAILGETNPSYTPPTNLAGTLYYYCEVTQTNGVGCNATTTTAEVIINLAPAINNQPISSNVCVNVTPTVLSFTYSNGVGTPTYQWFSNSTSNNTGGNVIIGETNATYTPPVTTSGTTYYYCIITFPSLSGGCSVITTNPAEVIVNDNPIIASATSTICSNNAFTITPANTGINIVPAGTTYTWSNPTISPAGSITGALAEANQQTNISQTLINTTTNPATVTYTVLPTSGTCVGPTFTITVIVNPSINPNVVVTNNTCFGVNSASISTNITGGIPFSSGSPYQITWTGPNGFTSSSTSISNISPGNYVLDILDAGNCPFQGNYIITEPADIVITVDSENDITCFNAANGSINITVTGGTGNYVYTWTKDTNPYPDTTQDIANLSPGIYNVSVTDANNCGPTTASFTITQPPLLVVSLVSQTNVLCFGAATGDININVIGGTLGSGYVFSWIGPNGFTSTNQNLNTLFAGTYDLTVTDANGCQKNLTVIITQSTEINIAYTTTPITCYGANNASITVTLSGGNPPYLYQWSNLATTLAQTNLSAGNYTITVSDSLGCPKSLTVTIPDAPVFTVNPIVSNITCFGANNGSINLNLTGGIAPVALTWSDNSTSGLIRNNLPAGTYTATISDGTPCYIVRTFTIIEPLPVVLSANTTNAFNCTNANSGAIDLIVAGGTHPFTYSWSNGATTEDLINITSGNYLVTVTDANGCIKTAQYAITRPDPITVNVTTQTTFDCATHSVNQDFVAQASGGIPGYQFQWSSGTITGANNEIMHSNANGTVLLSVTDTYGCTATQTVVVDTPVLGYPSFDTTSIGYTTYGIFAIGDPITFQSTITGDYLSVSWYFGDGTFSTDLNPIHTYVIPKDYVVTQTVTYPFGCVYVQTITLIVEKGYILVVPTAFTPNGDTINDTFRPVTKRLKNVRLDVYDTWGSIIYSETGDVLVGWDAKIKGFNAENGNYYAKVTAETFYGTVINENQPFVLIK